MNYIISSIILLSVILIIIYILSINNNSDKIKNKFVALYKVITSKKTNYLNNKDSNILLNFIKNNYTMYNNIVISKKIYYTKNLDTYILDNIEMIGYVLDSNNKFVEKKHILTIKFIPIKSDLFVGNNSLFGFNGNFYIETDSTTLSKSMIDTKSMTESKSIIENNLNTNITNVNNINTNNTNNTNNTDVNNTDVFNTDVFNTDVFNTDVLDLIPDIIHLSSEDTSTHITTITISPDNYKNSI